MELDLKFFLKMMKKRMWLIMIMVTIAGGISFYLSQYYLKPIYEASTMLMVNRMQEGAGQPALDYNTVNLNIKLIDVYKEIIKSPAIMDIVANQNRDMGYSSEQLIKKVKISGNSQTPIMLLSIEDGQHENAVRLINSIASVFQKQISTIMNVDNVVILNEAKRVDNPEAISPKLVFNLVVAMATTLLFMISIVIILEYLNDTLQSEEEIDAYLGIPTLTVIAKVKRSQMKAIRTSYSKKKLGGSTHASVH